MRKTLGIAVLMLAFCCPALAGEIPNPPAPQPTAAGEIQNDATDSLTQTVLDLLAVFPSLF
jgi:hypothetical protein